ncbi:MAG: hypothetical protein IKQ16_02385 [Lentisphaeria bacterium]|nr:hypothetical protein [Lentisphaeria bacterium]
MAAFRIDATISAIEGLLSSQYKVRISAMQSGVQFLAELKAISPDALPCVIIVFDGLDFNPETVCAEARISLVLVDRFRADSDDRAKKLYEQAADLMAYFPLLGREIGEAFITPEDVRAVSVDPMYAAIVLGLRVQQRSR